MALRQIVFILAVARVRRFWFKAAEATLVFAYRSEVQGVKSFCRGSQTDSGKRHHPKGLNTGTRTPQCSALRKRLAAKFRSKSWNGSCLFIFPELQGFHANSAAQRQGDGFHSCFGHVHNPKMIEHGNNLHLHRLRIIRMAFRHCNGGVACSPTSGRCE